MSWAVGFDATWGRDIGYGVPATCDQPACDEQIDRGLGFVCGREPYGGAKGCGLYFCAKHLFLDSHGTPLCDRCSDGQPPFDPKPDLPRWTRHKLTDPSWATWRQAHGHQEPASSGGPLTDVELAMLRFAGEWWRDGSAKEMAIRDRFGISVTRFHQVVNRLIATPAAQEVEPVIVNRLQRIVDTRRALIRRPTAAGQAS